MSVRIPTPEDVFDPPIKLFGCNIQLPDSHSLHTAPPGGSVSPDLEAPSSSAAAAAATTTTLTTMEIRKEAENYNAGGQLGSEDVDSQDLADDMHKDRNRSRSADSDHSQERERERERKVISGGKGFKKPDKILPCPRCNSMETKFCYFNNYNVNQPRHFCRNCQRYWTAGGTIRNVPVGAGRRKNKHLSSPAAGSSGGGDSPKPAGFSRDTREAHHQGGSDADALLLYNSVAATTTTTTLLTLQEDQNKLVKSSPPPTPCQNIVSPQQEVAQTNQFSSCGSHVGLVPPPPAAYTWNIGWNGMAAYGTDNGGALLVPWAFSPMGTYPPHGPGACHGPGVSGGISVPFPFVPPAASYVGWNASCWNLATSSQLSPSSSASNSNGSCCSGNSGSPSLGKHSRDLNAAQGEEEPVEKCLWVPKTLRMDDPDEAAKSSIWTTLGIKPDRIQPLSREVRVEKFDNASSRAPTKEADDGALQANPAALSRSQAFQEST